MFEKSKARIEKFEETHDKVRKVHQHIVDHREVYIAVPVALSAGYFLRGQTPEVKQIIKPKQTLVGYKSSQIMNTIVLPAKGDPGDVVQNMRTLETYASKGDLAKALSLPRSRVADYFAGRLPNLQGDDFTIIGKAGHPIEFA